jgi:hypothetical protein
MPQDKNKYYHAHSVQCRINHMAYGKSGISARGPKKSKSPRKREAPKSKKQGP